MTDRKKSAGLKKRLLKQHFEKLRNQFDGFNDDRAVFCNIYDMLMEALATMETVENNLVWVAFNNEYCKEFSDLQDIADRFA